LLDIAREQEFFAHGFVSFASRFFAQRFIFEQFHDSTAAASTVETRKAFTPLLSDAKSLS
jgi:hypothetical protein